MDRNMNNNKLNDNENYVVNICELFDQMDDILIRRQLPYHNFLYMGLDELIKNECFMNIIF